MILCPKCKERTAVYDSRIAFDGKTRRKRICPNCSHRFATIEILDEDRPLESHRTKALEKAAVRPTADVKKRKDTRKKVASKISKRSQRKDVDDYEDPLDDEFFDIARELGIEGIDKYD